MNFRSSVAEETEGLSEPLAPWMDRSWQMVGGHIVMENVAYSRITEIVYM